jgi:uncharacterized repeat protein (TIGR01451 family)
MKPLVEKLTVRILLSIAFLAASFIPIFAPVYAAQTINTTSTTSCSALGGSVSGANFLTDFNNGTFGTENGAPDQSPSVNPYPGQISGGTFANFYSITWGNYAFVANPVTRRNPSQHPGITDPVYGVTGRFFASDPNTSTPILNFTALNVTPNQNYQLSFWAANSEPNGLPNNINVEIDGIVTLNTGPLQAFASALEWKRYSFVFNAGNRTSILIALRSLETGNAGRDFYLDNVELRACNIIGGNISGTMYSDVNGNNTYQSAAEQTLANIGVDLYDTRGTASATDDIFVSTQGSVSAGTYNFVNVPGNSNYEVRVHATDPDLPFGATLGTASPLAAALTSGGNVTNKNFGFDLPLPIMTIEKTSSVPAMKFSIPGQDVDYAITVKNTGGARQDLDSNFVVDSLPPELTFRNLALGGSFTDPIDFSQSAANLQFSYASDVRYASGTVAPSSFAACNYVPSAGYDPAVRHICVRPRGVMSGNGTLTSYVIRFRAVIK